MTKSRTLVMVSIVLAMLVASIRYNDNEYDNANHC